MIRAKKGSKLTWQVDGYLKNNPIGVWVIPYDDYDTLGTVIFGRCTYTYKLCFKDPLVWGATACDALGLDPAGGALEVWRASFPQGGTMPARCTSIPAYIAHSVLGHRPSSSALDGEGGHASRERGQ